MIVADFVADRAADDGRGAERAGHRGAGHDARRDEIEGRRRRRRPGPQRARARRYPGQQCRRRQERRARRGHERRALAVPHGRQSGRRLLVLPRLRPAHAGAGRGSIVNIGSMSGFIVNKPQPQSFYNASKAAVHHLTQVARGRMGRARRARQRGRADLYRDAADRVRDEREPGNVQDLARNDADGARRAAGGDRLGRALPRLRRGEPADRLASCSRTAAIPAGSDCPRAAQRP